MKIQDFVDIHPDIIRLESEFPHGNGNVISVTTPAAGVFGGEKKKDLWLLVYECECSYSRRNPHEHHALYGPKIVQWDDSCLNCKQHKFANHSGHEYIPCGEEILDRTTLTLYAD